MLKSIGDGIWVHDVSFRLTGTEIGGRMTIVRTSDRRLIIYNPTPITELLVKTVRQLGTVAGIIAPNNFHHLNVGSWHKAFPKARLYIVEALENKRSDLKGRARLIDSKFKSPWLPEIELYLIRGRLKFAETVLWHQPSGSLVMADLAFNLALSGNAAQQIMQKVLFGGGSGFGPEWLMRLFIKGRDNESTFGQLLTKPIQQLVMAHGDLVTSAAQAKFKEAFKSYLPSNANRTEVG